MSNEDRQTDLRLEDTPPTLHDLRLHVRRLDDKLGGHIQSCRDFIDMCKEEAAAHTLRHNANERNAAQNSEDIRALIVSLGELSKATSGLVEAWSTANSVRKFVQWLGGFALIGGLFIWLVSNTRFIIKSIT